MEKRVFHLVFMEETGEVVYANTDQFKAQRVCLQLVKKRPDLHFVLRHVDAKTIIWSSRVELREAFKF